MRNAIRWIDVAGRVVPVALRLDSQPLTVREIHILTGTSADTHGQPVTAQVLVPGCGWWPMVTMAPRGVR